MIQVLCWMWWTEREIYCQFSLQGTAPEFHWTRRDQGHLRLKMRRLSRANSHEVMKQRMLTFVWKSINQTLYCHWLSEKCLLEWGLLLHRSLYGPSCVLSTSHKLIESGFRDAILIFCQLLILKNTYDNSWWKHRDTFFSINWHPQQRRHCGESGCIKWIRCDHSLSNTPWPLHGQTFDPPCLHWS